MSDNKQPVPARADPAPVKPQSSTGEIEAFIRQAKAEDPTVTMEDLVQMKIGVPRRVK